MSRFAECLIRSVVLLSTCQMSLLAVELDAESLSQGRETVGRETVVHVTTLSTAPTALYSDHTGRLLASVPGERGGLFVVDAERGETRRFIAGHVSGVSGSRDGKLFVASSSSILQVDLEAGWIVTDVSTRFACSNQVDRTVADREVADRGVADRGVADRGVADRRVADRRVADRRVADRRVADRKVADRGVADRRIAGNRDGSVWISGCGNFRDSSGEYLPQPEGIGGNLAPVASAYDLYDNHWALAPDPGGSTVAVVRAAGTPEVWQLVDPQPDGDHHNLLAIDASGYAWVSGGGSGIHRMDPHQPGEGWHVPIGAADWTARVTAMTRSHADGDILLGFDDGTLLEVEADSANTLTTHVVVPAGEGGGSVDLIHVDPMGHIWFASGVEVFRVEATAQAWQHSWAEVTPLPGGNHDIFAVELDRQLYVAGGLTAGWDFPANGRVFAEIFRFDPQTRSWSVAGEMPMARCHNGLTAFKGEVWIVGGRVNHDKPDSARGLVPIDEVIVFDPAKGTWRDAPSLNTARTEPVALVSKGRVYAIGGSDGEDSFSSVESIGPGEDSWRFEAETPRPIRQFAGCVLDDIIYVIGREGAFAYDPGTASWDELPAPEHLPQASYVTAFEGEIWALGDHRSSKSWRYSPAERQWRSGPDLPTPQSWGGAAVLDGRLYVIGGAHWATRLDQFVWDDRVFVLRPDWVAGD